MSHSQKSTPDEELDKTQLEDLVKKGLRKQKRCALCNQVFFVPELPGAISYKSVLELRKKWNEAELKLYRIPSPSQLYQRVELCIFCMQFFDVDAADTEGVPLSATQVRDRPPGKYSMSPKKKRQIDTVSKNDDSFTNNAGVSLAASQQQFH
jgi:hypothetical protein